MLRLMRVDERCERVQSIAVTCSRLGTPEALYLPERGLISPAPSGPALPSPPYCASLTLILPPSLCVPMHLIQTVEIVDYH
jgi:hypothetical protein